MINQLSKIHKTTHCFLCKTTTKVQPLYLCTFNKCQAFHLCTITWLFSFFEYNSIVIKRKESQTWVTIAQSRKSFSNRSKKKRGSPSESLKELLSLMVSTRTCRLSDAPVLLPIFHLKHLVRPYLSPSRTLRLYI